MHREVVVPGPCRAHRWESRDDRCPECLDALQASGAVVIARAAGLLETKFVTGMDREVIKLDVDVPVTGRVVLLSVYDETGVEVCLRLVSGELRELAKLANLVADIAEERSDLVGGVPAQPFRSE